MQKDEIQNSLNQEAETEAATPKNSEETSGGSTNDNQSILETGENKSCDADNIDEFERLIKGPYKEAFAKRVQGIINQRFKEKKTAEKSAVLRNEKGKYLSEEEKSTQNGDKNGVEKSFESDPALVAEAAQLAEKGYNDFSLSKELENHDFRALLESGVDMLTAYRAVHFEEIMENSVKIGAETAAKQMADSIRFKAGRPGENGLISQTGFGTRRGVSSLTPKARKELARKTLMGEKISF